MNDLDRMAKELHEAEEARDHAMTYLQTREGELANQMTQKDGTGCRHGWPARRARRG